MPQALIPWLSSFPTRPCLQCGAYQSRPGVVVTYIHPRDDSWLRRKRDAARKALGEIFGKVIRNRREHGIRHDDMLQAFMEAEYKDGEGLGTCVPLKGREAAGVPHRSTRWQARDALTIRSRGCSSGRSLPASTRAPSRRRGRRSTSCTTRPSKRASWRSR